MTVVVCGVGMTPFTKVSVEGAYHVRAGEAIRAALTDAGLKYTDLEFAAAAYAMGDTASGQAALYPMGLTGLPVVNVNNACASGSTAIYAARQAIEAGEARIALAVGFEQMGRTMKLGFPDQLSPVAWVDARTKALMGDDADISTVGWFAGAAREYLDRTGYGPEIFAHVAAKSRRYAAKNPYAAFREELSVEEILNSKTIVEPLTKFECSAPSNGAAAVILADEAYARQRGLRGDVRLVAQVLRSDFPSAHESRSMIATVGYDMSVSAAAALYEKTGVDPVDLDLVELHDCFASNEVITYEALGLAEPGKGGRMALDGNNTHGGQIVVNSSGGLLGKGHPIGATGVAQAVELVTQLRGEAGARQVEGARLALQHNLGLGGACVVGLYESASGVSGPRASP